MGFQILLIVNFIGLDVSQAFASSCNNFTKNEKNKSPSQLGWRFVFYQSLSKTCNSNAIRTYNPLCACLK